MQARKWEVRPSNLLGIQDPYVAFCLDEAVYELASWIEDELEKVEDRGKKRDPKKTAAKKRARLEFLLTGKIEKQFADPMRL